jgi:hypothetical protein
MEAECQPEGPITRDRGTGPGRTGARWTGRGKAKEKEWEKEKKRMGKGKEKGRRGETRFTQSINQQFNNPNPPPPSLNTQPSHFHLVSWERPSSSPIYSTAVLVRSLGYHINLHLSLSRLLSTTHDYTYDYSCDYSWDYSSILSIIPISSPGYNLPGTCPASSPRHLQYANPRRQSPGQTRDKVPSHYHRPTSCEPSLALPKH